MKFFNKPSNEQSNPYLFGDNQSNDASASSLSSQSVYDIDDTDDTNDDKDTYEASYEIDFWKPSKKLPKNVIAFKIRDENSEVVGYAVASAIDSFDILGTGLGEFDDADIRYLKDQMEKFCKVYYHEKSTGESTNSSGVSTDTP